MTVITLHTYSCASARTQCVLHKSWRCLRSSETPQELITGKMKGRRTWRSRGGLSCGWCWGGSRGGSWGGSCSSCWGGSWGGSRGSCTHRAYEQPRVENFSACLWRLWASLVEGTYHVSCSGLCTATASSLTMLRGRGVASNSVA